MHNNPVNFVDPLGLFGANWDKVHETITKRVAEDAVKGRRLKREWAKPFKRGLVSGSAWPDAPEGKYKGYKVVVRDKGTTGQGTLTWESHYGSKQYWHSMNPGGMSANEIKENILRQAGEWYDEAVELDRGKNPEGAGERIGRILHMVQDSHTESHTERDPKTGRIKEFKDYSKQDPEEHGKSDVPKEGNPESYRNLEKNLPGAKKAKEVSGQLVEAYLAKNKKRFMSVVEGNYELAEKGQSRKQKNEKD